MPDVNQLPHMLKLIDDDSPRVRQSITAALRAFGADLDQELARLTIPPDAAQLSAIRALIGEHPRFASGQIVKHKRYGYRAVVVAADATCQATDAWYHSNATHPDRHQPWYHLLVHDAEHTTYAAQSSLEADDDNREINHPWIGDFFTGFDNGRYIRNQRPWMT